MNMRVTAQTQAANAIANLDRQTAALAKTQNQLSTGSRIAAPSDDPAAYSAMTQAQSASNRYTAYSQTMSDATATLNAGVSALGQVNDVLTQAKQIAIEGANATNDQSDDSALATQVNALINQTLAAANTQVNGHSLFAGTATGTTPFSVGGADASGNPTNITYNGSAQRASALIGPNQTTDTRYAGNAVFQQSGADVFQSLIALRDTLNNPNLSSSDKSIALNQQLTTLNAAQTAIGNTTGEQSSSLSLLQATQNRMSDLKLASDTAVTAAGGTDYASAIVQMQQEQNVLQASLAVSAKLLQPTLLNFLQ